MTKPISLRSFVLAFCLPLFCALLTAQTNPPVPIIFDTDMGNDIDDTLALAMLHALESRGEAKLLAVTTTKDNPQVAPAVDALDTFYRRPGILIGVVKNGKTPKGSRMLSVPLGEKNADGSMVYPHDLMSGKEAPDAVDVLRKTLAAQPDGSVTIVQVGFSTNLARLLETDEDLIRRKVKLLVAMAGNFAKSEPEYNVKIDIPAARRVFENWPTPVVCSGYEVGEKILYPAKSIEEDFNYVPHHPVADAYRAYKKMPYDRPTWDLTAAIYAVRPEEQYFALSDSGRIAIDSNGNTRFTRGSGGNARYLLLENDTERKRVLAVFRELASQPPGVR